MKIQVILLMSCCLGIAACSGSSDDDNGAACIAGNWKLVSLSFGEHSITCPGSNPAVGLACTDTDFVDLKGDGTYTDSHAVTPDDSGRWFIHPGYENDIVTFDDDESPDNPEAHTVRLEGNSMFLGSLGAVTAKYERVGPAYECKQANDFNDLDRRILGKWELKTISVVNETVNCPGKLPSYNASCGAGETVEYFASNTYTDSEVLTPDDNGLFFTNSHGLTGESIIVKDDDLVDRNPVAFVYRIDGDKLVTKQQGGAVTLEYEKVN